MNIEEFVNDYLQEHRHDVLLSPYNGLIDFTNALKEQMLKEAVEGDITNAGGEFGYDVAAFRFDENHTYTVLLPHEEGRKHGDKVELIIVKGD